MSGQTSSKWSAPIKVLITGAGSLIGQGVIRSLRASSLTTQIIGVDPTPLSVGLYWSDVAYLIPMADAPEYLDRFRAILVQERPDVVLIGSDVELDIFAENREDLESEFHTRILVSSPDVIDIADDKWLTYQFLKANGFAYPESCLPGDEKELIESVGFPLVVKPRVGARSRGLQIVKDKSELEDALSIVANPIIQECVGDFEKEYTAGTLSVDGKCVASIVMRRHLRDGNTYRAFVEDYPELNSSVRQMADELGAFGPANFQFRLDNGTVKLFEINARFSGTTPLRSLAGFNEVDMILRYLLFGEAITQPKVESMMILRHWDDLVIRPKEALSFHEQ